MFLHNTQEPFLQYWLHEIGVFFLPSCLVILGWHVRVYVCPECLTHDWTSSALLLLPTLLAAADRDPCSKAQDYDSRTVDQPCIWFKEDPSQFSMGKTLQSLQNWPKKLALRCVISPLRLQAESRNQGHTFLANSLNCYSRTLEQGPLAAVSQ